MKNIFRALILLTMVSFVAVNVATAGNRDRSGQSGAQHLLIDPWAKSAGWGTVGVAEVRGLESIYSNIAGLTFINKLEFGFSRTQYLSGSNTGIGINSFAFAIKLKSKRQTDLGTLGISLYTMSFGDIPVTTVDQPEGTGATFSPNLTYIGVHYAYSFNKYISGGISGKIVTESISDLSAMGFAIDAGVQYTSGPYENFKIGATLKNFGLPMRYTGDAITIRGLVSNTNHELTLQQRTAQYELPVLLTLGISYDFLIFGDEYAEVSKEERRDRGLTRLDAEHRITLAGSFTANAYSRDLFGVGIEYGLRQFFQVRAGYMAEAGMWKETSTDTWYIGPSMGASFLIPLASKKNPAPFRKLILDYGYRFTRYYQGNHYIGLKVTL
jgi:hypothetical protein